MRAKASKARRRLAVAMIASALLASAAPAIPVVGGPATATASECGTGCGP
jgi:hypothetical protein